MATESIVFEDILVRTEEDSQVRVRALVRNGEPYIDIRNWWEPPNEDHFVPTKKGVRIHAENLTKLIAQLKTAEKQLSKKGV